MAVRAGGLTKRLTIQQTTQSQDGFGEPDDSWSTYATRWAGIDYEGGREFFGAESTRTARRAVIRVRGDSTTVAITPKMRGLLGSTVFHFLSVANVNERGEEMLIQAEVRG